MNEFRHSIRNKLYLFTMSIFYYGLLNILLGCGVEAGNPSDGDSVSPKARIFDNNFAFELIGTVFDSTSDAISNAYYKNNHSSQLKLMEDPSITSSYQCSKKDDGSIEVTYDYNGQFEKEFKRRDQSVSIIHEEETHAVAVWSDHGGKIDCDSEGSLAVIDWDIINQFTVNISFNTNAARSVIQESSGTIFKEGSFSNEGERSIVWEKESTSDTEILVTETISNKLKFKRTAERVPLHDPGPPPPNASQPPPPPPPPPSSSYTDSEQDQQHSVFQSSHRPPPPKGPLNIEGEIATIEGEELKVETIYSKESQDWTQKTIRTGSLVANDTYSLQNNATYHEITFENNSSCAPQNGLLSGILKTSTNDVSRSYSVDFSTSTAALTIDKSDRMTFQPGVCNFEKK